MADRWSIFLAGGDILDDVYLLWDCLLSWVGIDERVGSVY